MKIKINEAQPLADVVKTLESKGYWFNMDDGDNNHAKWVLVINDRYDIYNNNRCIDGGWCKLTTLAELKEM